MQLVINVEKRHIIFLAVLMCVLFVAGVNAAVNQGKTVGHDASEIVPGTFGGNLTSRFIFPGYVNIVNGLLFPRGEGLSSC